MENEVVVCQQGWKTLYSKVIQTVLSNDNAVKEPFKKIGIKKVYSENGMLKFLYYNEHNITQQVRKEALDASIKSLSICEICGSSENIGYAYGKVMATCCRKCLDKNFPNSEWIERKK